MHYFGCFFLDNEKDMIVELTRERSRGMDRSAEWPAVERRGVDCSAEWPAVERRGVDCSAEWPAEEHRGVDLQSACGAAPRGSFRLFYELSTPNHHSGNLIRNFAKVCGLPLSLRDDGLLVIRGEVPCYIDADAKEVFILRFGGTKVANIYPDGRIERKGSVPAIAKTLMSQTKDYRLDIGKTIFKTYIPREEKFRTDLHTHMNANLPPDVLIALGIVHQIRYPLYYIRKLGLELTKRQETYLAKKRAQVARQFVDSGLQGKYLDRRINDNTFLNFADLILGNLSHAEQNIVKIRISLTILKDGQAVFTNLEKVYLYRYVFCKGKPHRYRIQLRNLDRIPDEDVKRYVSQMLADRENPDFLSNTLYQDLLLWIARQYRRQGIEYAEISDTTLVKKYESLHMLQEVHEVMPAIYRETGVRLRFLAAMRRIPLTIVKDAVTPADYLMQNLTVLAATSLDPYVAGCDIVGEEINDINELKPMIRGIVRLAAKDPDFVIRIHAGENDSLRDNVAHSIACVRDSLLPGQTMPRMRIGHGLYTVSLRSAKGRELLKTIRDSHIVLEFQLTSNVRLNNLNSLDRHPLHEYLKAGIWCVQGTDGAALYGTNNIDEQLSLEKLLDMKPSEIMQMKEAESAVLQESREAFARKAASFRRILAGRKMSDVLLEKMEEAEEEVTGGHDHRSRFDANTVLEPIIEELPWDRLPVIICGGSFNSEKRSTRVTEEGCALIDALMKKLDPEETMFVIGNRLSGYEQYLFERNEQMMAHNGKGFRIFAFTPALITAAQRNRLLEAGRQGLRVRVSIESEGMGIYKSFNYEIFERRPSVLICFDGNSAAENLIQEARNGKGKSSIYIWDRAASLKKKADSLEGYVHMFGDAGTLLALVGACGGASEGLRAHVR